MSTIKDVARLAGVAPSTVSHYFTGNAPVKYATRVRIEDAIRELDYRPNAAARSLRLSVTNTIGLIVPNITNPFFAEIVQSVGHACQQMGYSLLLADSGNDENREMALLENMLRQYIDGMLVINTGLYENHPILRNSLPKPIVFVDREVTGGLSVATNNYAGGRMAAQHLLTLGHQRFGVLAGDHYVKNVQQRIEGFQDELNGYSTDTVVCQLINGPQSIETGYNVQMLMTSTAPPTAIFATNDIIALGAWHKLNEMGLRVPHDVSLVGYDNIDMACWTIPPLTTVAQDKRELGRLSVVTLINAIQTKNGASTTSYISPSLIVRGSTGPAPR